MVIMLFGKGGRIFWKHWVYILKAMGVYFANTCIRGVWFHSDSFNRLRPERKGKEWSFHRLAQQWVSTRRRDHDKDLPFVSRCVVSCFLFHFSPTWSFQTPIKWLKVAQTNLSVRPRFHIGSDAFSIPSSTPKTPASWHPRHDSTRLRQTCVAGHVAFISA